MKNFETVAQLKLAKLKDGQQVTTKGYYTAGDGGDALYLIKTPQTFDGYGDHELANGNIAVLQVKSIVNALQVGAIGDSDGTTGSGYDNTGSLQATIEAAKARGLNILIPNGKYRVTDTLSVLGVRGLKIFGRGGYTSQLSFDNAVADKELFYFGETSSYTELNGLALVDVTAQTSLAVKLNDKPDTSQPNWKNTFTGCRFVNFKTGHLTTDADPLDGASHTHLDGTLFEQCRFINCGTAYVNQNVQAVNINFVGTDIENSASGEEYTFFRDEAGATITVVGGSFIGKGIIYDAVYPSGGAGLWAGGAFVMDSVRVEARGGRTLPLLQLAAVLGSFFSQVTLKNCNIIAFSQNMTLADWAGKGNITVDNCYINTGSATLKLYPTSGITGAITADGREYFGNVNIKDSYGFNYEKQTSSPFGTYDEDVTAQVTTRTDLVSPNGQVTRDANSFSTLLYADQFQRGYGTCKIKENMVAYNGDKPTTGFTNVRLKLPFGATPSELVLFKQPIRRGSPITYKLYFVKDEADWGIPGAFDVLTDGILISDSGSTAGKCGLLSFPVEMTDTYLDATSYFQSGFAKWLEGRLYIEHSGTASQMVGFVGVRYI